MNYYIKTKHTKTVKVPKYKNKKVTKTKWKYKTVWVGTDYSDGFGNVYKKVNNKKYLSSYNGGWTYHKSFYKENRNTGVCKYYSVLKKKVKYTTTVKVMNGYKKVKAPVYAAIAPGDYCVGVCFTVEKGDYFDFISKMYYL